MHMSCAGTSLHCRPWATAKTRRAARWVRCRSRHSHPNIHYHVEAFSAGRGDHVELPYPPSTFPTIESDVIMPLLTYLRPFPPVCLSASASGCPGRDAVYAPHAQGVKEVRECQPLRKTIGVAMRTAAQVSSNKPINLLDVLIPKVVIVSR